MNIFFVILTLCFSFSVRGQESLNSELLDDLSQKPGEERLAHQQPEFSNHRVPQAKSRNLKPDSNPEIGNLPAYARRRSKVSESDIPTIVPKNSDFNQLIDLHRGEILRAVINQDFVGYLGSKSPVSARVIYGNYKGAILLGEATLDQNTKRVNVNFSAIRPDGSGTTYTMNGILTSDEGLLGVAGEYESNYWRYFWAESLANAVGGFADANTQKNQTFWGSFAPVPSVDTASKQGIASGASHTADRLGERMRSIQEITTVHGPIIVQITVL